MRHNNYQSYLQSWTEEIKSREDRVRSLIGDAHWLSDGNHKEYLLREFFNRYMPDSVTIGHGFIRSLESECSNEVDILISGRAMLPPYFNEGGLQIVPPENVLATIEVKTKFGSVELKQSLDRMFKNSELFIGSGLTVSPWQSAIFYNSDRGYESILNSIERELRRIIENNTSVYNKDNMRDHAVRPMPTCLVIIEKCIVMFSYSVDSCEVNISLYEAEGLSFSMACVDLFSYISSVMSHENMPTPLEISNSLISYPIQSRKIQL